MTSRRQPLSVLLSMFLSLLPCVVMAQRKTAEQSIGDTLPRFETVTPTTRDSARLVNAADDALQGQYGVIVPMEVQRFQRMRGQVEVTLRPKTSPNAEWLRLGGRVRILPDGRRIVVERH